MDRLRFKAHSPRAFSGLPTPTPTPTDTPTKLCSSDTEAARQHEGSEQRMSDGAQAQRNRSSDPASRFLIGILGTLFGLLAICTIVLMKPYVVRAIHRIDTARQQQTSVAVGRTIEKRRLARRPKLQECWIDCEALEGIRIHDSYGTTWADLQVCLHTSHRIVCR